MVAIVGEDALSERDKKFLKFADEFEKRFVKQNNHEDRSIQRTLDIGWELISILPISEIKKIDDKHIKKYLFESGFNWYIIYRPPSGNNGDENIPFELNF